MLGHDQLELFPLQFKLLQSLFAGAHNGLVVELEEICFRPEAEDINIPRHVQQHIVPYTLFATVGP